MTIVYTNARALMAIQATALAGEATTAGLTSLATALTNLATEITTNNTGGNTVDGDWVGTYGNGLFSIYSQQLLSAANIIKAHIENGIKSEMSAIKSDIDTMNTNIASQTTAINGLKSDLDTIATNSTTMATLASGTGMHVIGPYDWIGLISIYRLFIEQGKVLDKSQEVSADQLAAAISAAEGYIAKLRALPTLY